MGGVGEDRSTTLNSTPSTLTSLFLCVNIKMYIFYVTFFNNLCYIANNFYFYYKMNLTARWGAVRVDGDSVKIKSNQ